MKKLSSVIPVLLMFALAAAAPSTGPAEAGDTKYKLSAETDKVPDAVPDRTGACDACHGYPPAPRNAKYPARFGVQGSWSSAKFEDYSGGGGAHMVAAHVARDLRLTGIAADWTPCLPCHYDGVNAHARSLPARKQVKKVSVTLDPQYRFSKKYQMAYLSPQRVSGGANKTGTCFNTSCHMRPSPKWSSER